MLDTDPPNVDGARETARPGIAFSSAEAAPDKADAFIDPVSVWRAASIAGTEYIIEGGTVPDGVSYVLLCLPGRRFAFVLGGSVRTKAIAISTHARTASAPMGRST